MVRGMDCQTTKQSFSVEMKSKDHVKQILLSSKGRHPVLFEGFLGKLIKLSLVEDLMLEIKGKNGVIRIDITKYELRQLCEKNSKER
jgi:hypothetical protein